MLMCEPTPKMIVEWQNIFQQYKNKLVPNKKTACEVLKYLGDKYPITEMKEDIFKQIVTDNIVMNKFYMEKIPPGKSLQPLVYQVENIMAGRKLYKQQDDVFVGCNIIVGLEVETDYVMVEGSSLLYDELVAFQGLDDNDLTNYFLVAQYISCLERFGMLENVVL